MERALATRLSGFADSYLAQERIGGQVPLPHLSGEPWNIEATAVADLIRASESTDGEPPAGPAEGFEHQHEWLASRHGRMAASTAANVAGAF